MQAQQVFKNNNKLLSDADKKFYQEQGYLIIKDFIPKHVCLELMKRANNLVNEVDMNQLTTFFSTINHEHAKNKYFLESGNKIRFFLEEKAIHKNGKILIDKNQAINKIGHALHYLDPLFYCFSHLHQNILLAEALEIADPIVLQSMYIFKQPHIGAEVTCHQDATFLYLHDQIVTGLWFALEDATIENGCLWGIPGGHKSKLKSRMIRQKDEVNFEVYDETPFDLTKLIPLEVQQGSVIVLNGLFPHMSQENKSSKSRHAYTLHFASRNANYAKDNWLRVD